ncbi:MAG: hypothetical protein PHU33_15400 [Bacteroidales bacterium]|nr:hypothetical protein [Bacteroidales bacterium]
MNRTFFKTFAGMLVVTMIATLNVEAQKSDSISEPGSFFKNWRAEVHFGALAFHGDLSETGLPYMRDWRLGYGLTIEKQLGRYFGLRTNFINGKLAGRKDELGMKFESSLFEANLQTVFSFSKLWQDEALINNYRTYALMGVGVASWKTTSVEVYQPVKGTEAIQSSTSIDLSSNGSQVDGSVSVGLGINYSVAENVYLGVETSLHGATTDKMDAVIKGSAPVEQDMYSYTSIGLGYTFDLKKSAKPAQTNNSSANSWSAMKATNLANELPEIIQGKVGQSAPSTVDVIAWLVPDEIEEGEECTLNIQIYKAAIQGKGEIKVLLPDGYYAPDQEIGPDANLVSDDRNLTINLDKLPEQFDFTLAVKIRSGKNPQGRYAIYILGRITDDQNTQYKLSSVVNFKQLAPISANR